MAFHGTRTMYNNSHCRCDACKAANASYQRNWQKGVKLAGKFLIESWPVRFQLMQALILYSGHVTVTGLSVRFGISKALLTGSFLRHGKMRAHTAQQYSEMIERALTYESYTGEVEGTRPGAAEYKQLVQHKLTTLRMDYSALAVPAKEFYDEVVGKAWYADDALMELAVEKTLSVQEAVFLANTSARLAVRERLHRLP